MSFLGLQLACATGNMREIRNIFKALPVKKRAPAARVVLRRACVCGHIDIIKYLIKDRKVDIRAPFEDGMTPFLIACSNGHLETVRYFVETVRVDPRLEKTQLTVGGSVGPICYALRQFHVLRYLVEEQGLSVADCGYPKIIWHTHCFGNYKLVRYLIEHGAPDENLSDVLQSAILNAACRAGSVDDLGWFLARWRVDVNRQGQDKPLIHIAFQMQHMPTIRLLVEKFRADVSIRDHKGRLCLKDILYSPQLFRYYFCHISPSGCVPEPWKGA